MTTVHWITVSEALRVRIQTELSIQVERRYAAFLDKSKVKTPGKYIVIPSAMEQEAKTLDRPINDHRRRRISNRSAGS